MTAHYRKHNDGSCNSSTYHKKDGTPVRAILSREAAEEIAEATAETELVRAAPRMYEVLQECLETLPRLVAIADHESVVSAVDAGESLLANVKSVLTQVDGVAR